MATRTLPLPVPTANPERLGPGETVEYVGRTMCNVLRDERGEVASVSPDPRTAPVAVDWERAGRLNHWPMELRRVAELAR